MPENTLKDKLELVPPKNTVLVTDIAKDADGKTTIEHSTKVLEPIRAESPRRAHQFSSIDSFCEYVKRAGGAKTLITIDPKDGSASAILDEGNAKGFECVTYRMTKAAQVAMWIDACGRKLGMPDWANFIDERRGDIAGALLEDGTTIPVSALRRLVSQIVVSVDQKTFGGRGAESLNGVLIKTKVSSANVGDQREVALPDRICLKVPLFVDDPRSDDVLTFSFDVSCDTERAYGRLTFGEYAAEVQKRVSRTYNSCLVVAKEIGGIAGYGNVNHQQWDYVR